MVEADYFLGGGLVGSQVAPASSHSSVCISSLKSTEGGSVCILTYQSMSVLLCLGKLLPLAALRLNAFNYPWKYQVSYVFPPRALGPLVLSMFFAENVTGQFRLIKWYLV